MHGKMGKAIIENNYNNIGERNRGDKKNENNIKTKQYKNENNIKTT